MYFPCLFCTNFQQAMRPAPRIRGWLQNRVFLAIHEESDNRPETKIGWHSVYFRPITTTSSDNPPSQQKSSVRKTFDPVSWYRKAGLRNFRTLGDFAKPAWCRSVNWQIWKWDKCVFSGAKVDPLSEGCYAKKNRIIRNLRSCIHAAWYRIAGFKMGTKSPNAHRLQRVGQRSFKSNGLGVHVDRLSERESSWNPRSRRKFEFLRNSTERIENKKEFKHQYRKR